MLLKFFTLAILACLTLAAQPLAAQGLVQGFDTQAPVVDLRGDETDYSGAAYTQPIQAPSYEPNPRAIIHQNAQTRAQQRQLRMASMAWYGLSNSRPTASPTPFTTLYSPVWQMPGGRPYAWYSTSRPTYLIYR
jgi:hypothetical protein